MNNGIIWKTLELKSTRNYGVAVEKFLAIKAMPLTLGTSGKEFEMCAKSHSCVSVPGHSLAQNCWNVKIRCVGKREAVAGG